MACKMVNFTNALITRNSFPPQFKLPLLLFSSSSSCANPFHSLASSLPRVSNSSLISTNNFTWDDVIRIAHSQSGPSDIQGLFDRVSDCNRNLDKQSEFVPFVVEDQIVGYIHNGFVGHLRRFKDVFLIQEGVQQSINFTFHVTLHPTLTSPADRTSAVRDVIKCLGEELIPGIRNELYPVMSSFGSQVFFSLERAAAPYFGIKVYGVQMNGYVEKEGQEYLWIGKRSQEKSTYPGMLDNLVAGGLPHGIPCGENMMKECEEEAGIPISISNKVVPVGAVSYMDINGHRFKRDVLFCYDLKLPEDFLPNNQDGEVESFRLIPAPQVVNVIKQTRFFKSNCVLVIIDFLFRHGYICPEFPGYLNLLKTLKLGDFS